VCEKAYQLDQDSARINALRGYYLYEYQYNFDQAFQAHKKALSINPNIGEVNFLAGICYLYHGLYRQAIPLLLKAYELDPYYFWTPYKLAMCYTSTKEFEKGAYYYEKYFELAPIQPLIFPGRFVSLNIMTKNFEKAEKLLSEADEQNPANTWTKIYRAILHAAKGEEDLAFALDKNIEVLALLGKKEQAIRLLDEEILKRNITPYIYYLDLLNNPFYDNLRDNPRFNAMVQREKSLYEEHKKQYGIEK
jgi:tetratricopeptide (TPR) repeat protein